LGEKKLWLGQFQVSRLALLQLVCVCIGASGFVQGFLILDFAFDYVVWTKNLFAPGAVEISVLGTNQNTTDIYVKAFSYYSTILNNYAVNMSVLIAIVCTHYASYRAWRGTRLARKAAKKGEIELPLRENRVSRAFRNIFLQYCLASSIYGIVIMPRYMPFLDQLVHSIEITSIVDAVKHSRPLSAVGTAFHLHALFEDWSTIVLARIVLVVVNMNIVLSLFLMLPVLLDLAEKPAKPLVRTSRLPSFLRGYKSD